MRDIEVVIRGRPKTGKTTLASIIAKHLSELGIVVRVVDDSRIASILSKDPNVLSGKTVTILTEGINE